MKYCMYTGFSQKRIHCAHRSTNKRTKATTTKKRITKRTNKFATSMRCWTVYIALMITVNSHLVTDFESSYKMLLRRRSETNVSSMYLHKYTQYIIFIKLTPTSECVYVIKQRFKLHLSGRYFAGALSLSLYLSVRLYDMST